MVEIVIYIVVNFSDTQDGIAVIKHQFINNGHQGIINKNVEERSTMKLLMRSVRILFFLLANHHVLTIYLTVTLIQVSRRREQERRKKELLRQ
jgi:hypothetical protein